MNNYKNILHIGSVRLSGYDYCLSAVSRFSVSRSMYCCMIAFNFNSIASCSGTVPMMLCSIFQSPSR